MAVLELIPKKAKKTARTSPAPVAFPRYEPPTFPSRHPVPERLAQKLKALGRRFFLVRISERVAQCVTGAVMLLTLQMVIDWLTDLPFLVRLVFLAGDLALLGFFIRKYLLPLLRRAPSQENCALMVEKHWPRLRGRIIAAVQLARPRQTLDAADLVAALQKEAEARTLSLDFGEIVPLRPLLRRVGTAVTVTGLAICLFIVSEPGSIALLERLFLLSAKVPRKTQVICLSGNKIIPVGDSVVLEAQARGIVPSHGQATLTYDSGRVQEITLDPEPDHSDRFSLKIDSMDESMHYTIQLNDGISDPYTVKIVPRPGVTTIDCEQTYPAYTGLAPVKRMVGNLALLAGSRLQIHAVANGKIAHASLKLVGVNQVIPLTVGGADGRDLTGEIAIPSAGLTGFSIVLTNQAGITSGDETQYPIDLIPDRPPTVDITFPDQLEELNTLKAKPTIAFAANDDYGLAKVTLCYRITHDQDASNEDNSGTAPTLPEPNRIDLDMGGKNLLDVKSEYSLDLSAIKPPITEGCTVEYWIEARDANNVTGPGIGESEHHTIKVVSEVDFKADVMRRLDEALGAVDDLNSSQKETNGTLGKVIQGKTDQN